MIPVYDSRFGKLPDIDSGAFLGWMFWTVQFRGTKRERERERDFLSTILNDIYEFPVILARAKEDYHIWHQIITTSKSS